MGFVGWFRREFNWSDGYVRLAILVIILAALLRFALAAVSHPAGDSCWHLSVARFMAENGRIPFSEPFGIVDRQFFSAAPLFHFVAAFVYSFFSLFSLPAAEFAYKLVSPFFGSLTLPFVFLFGRRFGSSRIAFFATLFVAFLPLHINSSVVSFVDSLATLMAVVAVYFLLCRRFFLSALFIGLGMAAKQTMIVLVPFFFLALLFYNRTSMKKFVSLSAISAFIISAIGLPWFARNFLLLGNPVWPFMSRLFGGMPLPELAREHAGFSLMHLLSFARLARFHLELFGAPIGSLGSLSFINLPFLGFFVAAWLSLTILFLAPVFVGILSSFRRQNAPFLHGWIAVFVLVQALFIVSTGLTSARYFLPAIPAVAIFWAFGLDSIMRKFSSNKLFGIKSFAAIAVVVLGCIFAFSAVEAAKTVVAANAWSAYSGDFQWMRENTPEDALIGYNGQCLSYNVHRFSNYNLGKVDYVWVNQNFQLEPVSIVQPGQLQLIERDFVLVYENKVTGTKIYKRKL